MSTSVPRVLELVRSGQALSRTALADHLNLAPSTVSQLVAKLIRLGLLEEGGSQRSTGGRKPRILTVRGSAGHVLAGELGSTHARVGLVDLAGSLVTYQEQPLSIAEGPEPSLHAVQQMFAELSTKAPRGSVLQGVSLGLPGPVDEAAGATISPSRMPGWHGYAVREWLEHRNQSPVVVENDANLMAFGEYSSSPDLGANLVCVKVGTGIGAGVIAGGRLYRGTTAMAGDISHARVQAAGDRPCACGNRGCLETVASGAAIVSELRSQGVDIIDVAGVIDLVHEGDPRATPLVRTAGHHLGSVLAVVVNFFNPSAVLLGGALSTCEPFIASVRSQLYESCHPLATRSLTISSLATGENAVILGGARSILEQKISTPDDAFRSTEDLVPLGETV
ncbi:ROK family protein [Pseudactinotalea sp. Z1748]|uniref:ROK family protein n=1 Tax=Pseudactinotalea sp. Z1748 TaxID=3413027 RepID=UPI003C7AD3DB